MIKGNARAKGHTDQTEMVSRPRVLFWPLGNPELETAQQDGRDALENLKQTDLDIVSVDKMTWWEPSEIPGLARKAPKKDIDLIVIFSATHGTVRCITAIGERFRKIPLLIWSIPIRYSLATSGLGAEYLRDRGHSVKLLNNSPGDIAVREEITAAARAARSFRLSKSFRIGLIGNLSPLMISLPYNLTLLKRKLGPLTLKISLPRLANTLKSVKDSEISDKLTEYKSKYSSKVSDQTLANALRFQLAIRKFVQDYKLDGIALECWTNLFPKYGVNPCLGHLDDLAIGCEGDIVSLAGSLILENINGVKPYLADILGVDKEKNTIELSHCSAPISLAADSSKVSIGERTDPRSKGKTAFVNFDLRQGPATLVRFYGKGLDKIHMTCGYLQSKGDYWGGISLVVESKGNTSEFLDNVSGNHYLFAYGDIRKELRMFAEMKGLQVIEN